jgi:hypothetical protein
MYPNCFLVRNSANNGSPIIDRNTAIIAAFLAVVTPI